MHVKPTRLTGLVLTVLIAGSMALPAVAVAGGDKVQHGRPSEEMPYAGAGDRTDGQWGNPDAHFGS